MTRTEEFAAFQARRREEEARAAHGRVTWRKVSETTGGGWSGIGRQGRLVYVVGPLLFGGRDGDYGFGYVDERGLRCAAGARPTLREAKAAAAGVIDQAATKEARAAIGSATSDPTPEEETT